jgi:ubiquitin-protein ligase
MSDQRVQNEYLRLKRLEGASGGVVALAASPNRRHYDITLRVPAPVGTDEHYTVEREHQLTLDLPDGFPARKPLLRFAKPILAPNIWPSGVPCIVEHNWMPAMHLDQVLCDVIEELQGLSPNYGSVANTAAGELYLRPGFEAALRQRLGPPVRLVPPPEPAAVPISTALGVGTAPSRPSGIQTAATPAPARGGAGIATVR